MAKKVNIIGAGLAGLSAGIYLQKKGYQTEIFELAPWAGGMCTSWLGNGYLFDGCIHWMVGTKKGGAVYELYKEVGALNDDTEIYNTQFIRIENGGIMYEIPMNIEKFKEFLLRLSKQDEAIINEFCVDIKAMMKSELLLGAPEGIGSAVRMLVKSRGFLLLAKKLMKKTVGEYIQGFKSSIIKDIIKSLMGSEFSAIALIMMLGTRMGDNAGYPMGGARGVTDRMVKKYEALGGNLRYNSRVDDIIIENGSVAGIRSKGEVFSSDVVVAACDAYDTLENMLGGKFTHPQLTEMLKTAPLFKPLALVSFGLNRQMDIPYMVTYECPEGIETAPGILSHYLAVRSFDFDPGAAPMGCSSVMAIIEAPFDYWNELRNEDIEEYKRQKQLLAESTADFLDKRIPGFKDAIEVVDVSTPATYKRLTNVYKGSYEGFAPISSMVERGIKKTIPELKGFYICGQWTTVGGGICTAVADGKTIANMISKDMK